ncbi:MAG: glycine cleavage system aminomethyltransferase GcvT [Halarsenatibacteraceae bacterium]
MDCLKKTALNQLHHKLGAKMIDFGGWEMPVQYTGIIEEHQAVRNDCGLFDVSHMGEIEVTGSGASSFVNQLVTNQADVEVGRVVYTPMCYENGGIIDDLLVYRIKKDHYMLVVNASNKDKDFEWVSKKAPADVEVKDLSAQYGLLALQGPKSEEVLGSLVDFDLSELKTFRLVNQRVKGKEMIISRTGYTGEDGFELYLNPEDAESTWNAIMEAGEEYDIMPAGLGCRNTLRLEAALCLYGNDINEETNPLEAGLSWTVKFDKEDFYGKSALVEAKDAGLDRKLVGFILKDRGIARHDYDIEVDGKKAGFVTSGSFSPTLDENIGMGYLQKEFAEADKEITIMIRNRGVKAKVVELPFI